MERQYRLLAQLEHQFDHVIETCEALIGHAERHPPDGWVLGGAPFEARWLHHALLDFWYQDGQDGRATRNYIGLVAAYGLGGSLPKYLGAPAVQELMIAIIWTSTLLHFYFDGFIWKVRETGTQAGLGIEPTTDVGNNGRSVSCGYLY